MEATVTETEQRKVESRVSSIYHNLSQLPKRPQTVLLEIARDSHSDYLTTGLRHLPSSISVLDANRPWLCYWILHSLALLGEPIDEPLKNNIIEFISKCKDPDTGGYGGGPGQMGHLATTYASVNSLVTLGGDRALSSIDRDGLYAFLVRMKQPDGCFRMHENGESDVRACYTAIATASILNILDCDLVENVGNFIASCQTYEGGIAGEPGSEAHGAYTFCGLATLILIDEVHRLDLHGLVNWVVFRQGVEGGFQGRSNKLVDGCYSFFQGAVFPLIQRYLKPIDNGESSLLFHNMALQQYIILCCQDLEGGFKDKPGKTRDFYHTCYCLSGLSVCHYMGSPEVLGPYSNVLKSMHPLYNVVLDHYNEAREFFTNL